MFQTKRESLFGPSLQAVCCLWALGLVALFEFGRLLSSSYRSCSLSTKLPHRAGDKVVRQWCLAVGMSRPFPAIFISSDQRFDKMERALHLRPICTFLLTCGSGGHRERMALFCSNCLVQDALQQKQLQVRTTIQGQGKCTSPVQTTCVESGRL